MKDNPRLHLDFLETQLARLESKEAYGKLDKTKHLLKRYQKLGQLSSNPDELRTEIAAVKREIIKRKIHYTDSTVKRCVKQFKKIEPMRIKKREKKIAADQNQKLENLQQELKFIESLDPSEISSDVVIRSIAKRFNVIDVLGEAVAKRALTVPESNVYGRICKTEAIRTALQNLNDAIHEFYEETAEYKEGVKAKAQAKLTTNQKSNSNSDLKIENEIENEMDTENRNKNTIKNNNNNDHNTDDFTEFAEEDLDDFKSSAKQQRSEPEIDPFFEQPVALADPDLDISDSESEMLQDENGLPLLNQGYISGSEDDEDVPVVNVQPERKNRRGQRARRKIWEQKFGKRANHVIKEQQEAQKREQEKEKKRKLKEQKMKQRLEFEAKPLHPSWEAQMKRKQELSAAKFNGKKVKFN